ncbi:MAG TPA: N-acetylmuramoyl-L-alanine amidase [Solirubrobacteraceae bacterium]|nr:N-acetylmuramoyl-L-alanine amidase [Solirubrobacteraceae bacterium]
MSARRITRRSLLVASAGALGSGVLRPRTALALFDGPPYPSLNEHWLGTLTPMSVATVALASPADLVGVEWQGSAQEKISLRFRGRDGRWASWVSAGANGHGPDVRPATDRQVGEPIWTGGTTSVQIRAAGRVSDAKLHLVNVEGNAEAGRNGRTAAPLALTASLPLATPELSAGAGQPPIIARKAWAREMAPPKVTPEYGAVEMAFVHHTENPNGYGAGAVPAMLRAIYMFHRYVNGWNDIGYNFVVDLYGRVFEARAGGIDQPVVGAQAGGYNLYSTGIAVLGTFSSTPISKAARDSLEKLLAWKLSLHGVPAHGRVTVKVNPAGASYSRFPANARVSLPRIAGHRDGDATECPGNVLYGELPAIRMGARRLAPNPTGVTLALTTPEVAPETQATPEPGGTPEPGSTAVPGSSPASQAQMLSGVIELLDGTPLSGAPVLIQARTVAHKGEVVSERTLGETTTNSAGQWELDATPLSPPGGGIWLRALCPGGPGFGAAVSDSLHLPGNVSLTAPTTSPPAG